MNARGRRPLPQRLELAHDARNPGLAQPLRRRARGTLSPLGLRGRQLRRRGRLRSRRGRHGPPRTFQGVDARPDFPIKRRRERVLASRVARLQGLPPIHEQEPRRDRVLVGDHPDVGTLGNSRNFSHLAQRNNPQVRRPEEGIVELRRLGFRSRGAGASRKRAAVLAPGGHGVANRIRQRRRDIHASPVRGAVELQFRARRRPQAGSQDTMPIFGRRAVPRELAAVPRLQSREPSLPRRRLAQHNKLAARCFRRDALEQPHIRRQRNQMSLVRRHDPAQGRRRLLIDLEQSALHRREAGGRLAVVPRRLVDALEGREAVQNLRRGGRADARAVEDAGRLQDVRRAPRPRGEPSRRDEQVEDVGAGREARRADEQLPKGLELVGTQGPPAYRRQDRGFSER
mmetsp:Transcript_2697/g.7816  ORF Transcript_2697/g.7816 Transcript_2697/m.7816 type:complete len:400 (-) Transcript_2697:750-1949(-)